MGPWRLPVRPLPSEFGHSLLCSLPQGPPGASGAEQHMAYQCVGMWLQHRWSVGLSRLPPAAEAWFKAPSFPTGAAAPCHGQGTCGEWLPHVTPPCLRSPLGPHWVLPGVQSQFTQPPLLAWEVWSSHTAPHPKGTWVGAVAGLLAQDTVACCQRGEIVVSPTAWAAQM